MILLMIVPLLDLVHSIELHSVDSIFPLYTHRYDQLCSSKYPDRLLYSSVPIKCQLKCSWFTSSSPEYIDYYNANEDSVHDLDDTELCEVDSICHSGSCVQLKELKGQAKLTIGRCYLPSYRDHEIDSYIEVYVSSKVSKMRYIGETKVIYGTSYPNFNQQFESPEVSREGRFKLLIFQRDAWDYQAKSDLIKLINLRFIDCDGQRSICTASFGDYQVNYTIEWIPN